MALYVLDENNNKIEVTDQVLTALVEQVRCCVSGTPYKLAFVTQAKYNELVANNLLELNTRYEIIDDTTCEDIDAILIKLNADVEALLTRGREYEVQGVNNIEYQGSIIKQHLYFTIDRAGLYSFSMIDGNINSGALYVGDTQQLAVNKIITELITIKDLATPQSFKINDAIEFIYLPNGGHTISDTTITYPARSLVLLNGTREADVQYSGRLKYIC